MLLATMVYSILCGFALWKIPPSYKPSSKVFLSFTSPMATIELPLPITSESSKEKEQEKMGMSLKGTSLSIFSLPSITLKVT